LNLEVQFSALYEGTPLFGEVDLFLRERGFTLWRLRELSHCGFDNDPAGLQVPEILDYDTRRVEVQAGGGQLLWANALYVRRETTQPSQPIGWEDALRDACLAQAYRYGDLAEVCLRRALPGAAEGAKTVFREALSSREIFGASRPDPLKEKQAVIEQLKQAADERLALIEDLNETAAARLQALQDAQARLQAQEAELEQWRRRSG
jgi:hypothetical protein